MNYLPMMTEDEISYVCSAIPLKVIVWYFNRYPKSFGKIMPGFRATSLRNQEQVSNVLFRNRNQHFISSFLETQISHWLKEIESVISEKMDKGESKENALLQTLPHCYFVDNIELYLKLAGEEYSEECISILGTSIRMIKDSDNERERIEATLNAKESEVGHIKAELESVQFELSRTSKKLSDCFGEIKLLKNTNADLEKLKGVIQSNEQAIDTLKQESQEREKYIQKLKTELSTARNEQQQLEEKINEELEKQRENEYKEQESSRKPRCPKDMEEFKDYLGYNMENLGVPSGADYYSLLKDYLSEILFQGKPIIISRNTGVSLMKCVSNTLVKTPAVPTLTFVPDIEERAIDVFLSQDKRIVCLDNFIGYYDESILLTVCDKHKDKIIFMTIAYERTLCYVPEELMKYCHYLNINRIEAFVGGQELTEDPSTVDETETLNPVIIPDARWSSALKDMLDAFGIRGALSTYKSLLVVDEMSLCRLLAFDVLPYCVDVLKIAPFNTSDRLVKYAGVGGRCLYKDLLRRWFS